MKKSSLVLQWCSRQCSRKKKSKYFFFFFSLGSIFPFTWPRHYLGSLMSCFFDIMAEPLKLHKSKIFFSLICAFLLKHLPRITKPPISILGFLSSINLNPSFKNETFNPKVHICLHSTFLAFDIWQTQGVIYCLLIS